MNTICGLLWFGKIRFYPYPYGLPHRLLGSDTIASVPVKQPWRIWMNKSYKSPFITTWMSNHMSIKVWDEITYPFLNFNGATVEV